MHTRSRRSCLRNERDAARESNPQGRPDASSRRSAPPSLHATTDATSSGATATSAPIARAFSRACRRVDGRNRSSGVEGDLHRVKSEAAGAGDQDPLATAERAADPERRATASQRRPWQRPQRRSSAVEPEDVVGAQHDVLREAAVAAPPHPPGVGTERVVAGATPPAVAARLVQVTAPRAPSNASSPATTSPATS